MSQTVYVNGKRYILNPSQAIGKGGEADIYQIGPDAALKLFKQPDHPDLVNSPQEQKGAILRIQGHQKKLPAYPVGLPGVVAPRSLVTNPKNGPIVGYVMKLIQGAEVLLRYRENSFRSSGVKNEDVVQVFEMLHGLVQGIHQKQVVLGDFNDLNILVKADPQKQGHQIFLIDADSFQFGNFLCRTFTETFVDPLLCDAAATSPTLIKKHNDMSDWYAYTVMLMQTLLCLARGPYGGVYRPKDKQKKIPDRQRPLKRITVFDSEVRYPKPSRPLEILPDPLLDHFEAVFAKDRRQEFPVGLLREIQWTTCTNCGKSHARGVCPFCNHAPLASKRYVSDGKVEARRLLDTSGRVVLVVVESGALRYLYYHPKNQLFLRESGPTGPLKAFQLTPGMRYAISRQKTMICEGQRASIYSNGDVESSFSVDMFYGVPVIGANDQAFYFIQGGVLKKTDLFNTTFFNNMGNVLAGQSMFWVGEYWGFGFYLAGTISQCFTFSTTRKGINDSVKLNPFKGKLLEARCFFDKDKIWFFISSQVGGQTVNNCHLLNADGTEIATAEDFADSGGWLGGFKGNVAVGGSLLVPTDDGVLRVKEQHGQLIVDKEFPETSKFVHSGKRLFVTKDGLISVGSRTIWKLVVK